MGDLDVAALLHLDEVQNQRSDWEDNKRNFAYEFVLAVCVQKYHWEDEDLHVVLQVPAPAHAHFLSVVDQVVYEKHRFPNLRTVLNLVSSFILKPKNPVSRLQKHRVKYQDGH